MATRRAGCKSDLLPARPPTSKARSKMLRKAARRARSEIAFETIQARRMVRAFAQGC